MKILKLIPYYTSLHIVMGLTRKGSFRDASWKDRFGMMLEAFGIAIFGIGMAVWVVVDACFRSITRSSNSTKN